jgi:hypothetical protein
MCECERELALAFLPHQVDFAVEFGTGKRFSVDGFASRICAKCSGEVEEPHPRAAIWGLKGKVERYYWREIFKTYCELLLDHYGTERPFRDVTVHDEKFPEIAKRFRQRAKDHWKEEHHIRPLYDTRERTESQFLSVVSVPERVIEAPYRLAEKNGQKIGRWVDNSGSQVSAETLTAKTYEDQGFEVLRCERRLITVWVGTFLGLPIQDPNDPDTQVCMRHSTKGWTSQNRDTPLIWFNLPKNFGSAAYFESRRSALISWLDGMRASENLIVLYDQLIQETEPIRDYLWAAEEDTIRLGRKALEIIPKSIVIGSIDWAIRDFWNRQVGWPDFLILGEGQYRFSEVKSPNDKLSQDQMNWFEWAIRCASVPCEIVRVKRCR